MTVARIRAAPGILHTYSLRVSTSTTTFGWNGNGVGPKGHDSTLLEGYTIVDDPAAPASAEPTVDEDGDVCLHERIEPFEDEPGVGACQQCGEEFPLRGASESVAAA